jgi:hypothetical protein
MFSRISILLTVILLLLLASTAVLADDPGFPWQDDHAAPFDFTFGNLIDNHQQSKVVRNGMLQGFVYIQFIGEENGVPVAERADCENPDLDCRVGWKVKGIPFTATLVSKGPRKWLVDETLLPASGSYVHFHWVGTPRKPCGLKIGDTKSGFLLQRTAVTEFQWLGGNSANGHGGHLVTPGMDLHSNIVTVWNGDPGGGGEPGGGGDHDEGDCGGHDGGSGGPPDGSGEPGGEGGDDSTGGGCSGHEDGEDDGCSGHDSGSAEPAGPDGPAAMDPFSVIKISKTTAISR